MSGTIFNPENSICPDWKKIFPGYKRHLAFLENPGKCEECGKPATNRCSACHIVAYCSTNHQKSHWKSSHRNNCCPFKLVRDPEQSHLGRFVVATRDIKPGEIIMEEPPIAAGPRQFTQPVCLGCHKDVDGSFKCEKCGWPMCNEKCCQAPIHTVAGECDLLSKCKLKPKFGEGISPSQNPIYECLTPLRCSLIKDLVPDNWEVMVRMEQHTEERKCEPFYPVNQTNTVRFLRQHILKNLQSKKSDETIETFENGNDVEQECPITEEEINAMIDVLDVNAFEIRGQEFSIRGVYPLTAMMNSVCNPNTQNCIGNDFICRVRAAIPIKKGQEITATYTLTLAGTMYRQKHLQDSKYFNCKCLRCCDPTELGSNFSTIFCQKCGDGHVLSTNPTNVFANWKCLKCGDVKKQKDVEEFVETLEKEVSELPLERAPYEEKLLLYAKALHPNHHIMTDLKITLVQLYGRDQPAKEEMMAEALRKKDLCESVISIMDKITPGRFRLRGMFLSELYGIILFLSKKSYDAGELTQQEFIEKLEYARDILDEATEILSYEPHDTIEGIRCRTTRDFKVQLEKLIFNQKQLVSEVPNEVKEEQPNEDLKQNDNKKSGKRKK